jgi:hypothetical protein
MKNKPVVVVHVCYPSYLGGRIGGSWLETGPGKTKLIFEKAGRVV